MDSQETLNKEENIIENEVTNNNEAPAVYNTQEEVVARLKSLAQADEVADRSETESLKQAFYKIHKNNVDAARTEFIAQGGNPEMFIPAPNALEDEFKAAMNIIKKRRAEAQTRIEEEKAKNLARKKEILARIKEVCATPEEANQAYKEVKELQAEWKEIKLIPAEDATELWKSYQLYTEQYYDQLKLNNEFREYDFKKNLEAKTELCEKAEKLADEEDVVAAFKALQALHQEYKETGPVAKELREEIWARFKAASTVINKKHQDHFESIKLKEEANLAAKTALCEKVEAINPEACKTMADWEKATTEIIDTQKEWRTIGFAPQKMNVKIFDRFRQACDKFFTAKTEYFKSLKENQAENLAKKTALCEQVEALKDSTDWKATADKIIALQKEWKTIGAVSKKYSDTVWKRFVAACDFFFEQKNKNASSHRNEEKENLAKKKQVIEQLKAILTGDDSNKTEQVKALMKEWNEIGFVPFKEKDKIYKLYHDTVDEIYKSLNLSQAKRRLESFKQNLKDGAKGLSREREHLTRIYEAKKAEIKTYENNLGFLTAQSKKGNSLVDEMARKMEKLKDELALIADKIKAVDNEMNKTED